MQNLYKHNLIKMRYVMGFYRKSLIKRFNSLKSFRSEVW